MPLPDLSFKAQVTYCVGSLPYLSGREEASHALEVNVNGPTMLHGGVLMEYPLKYPTFTM